MHQREENYVQYFDDVPVLTPYLVKKSNGRNRLIDEMGKVSFENGICSLTDV